MRNFKLSSPLAAIALTLSNLMLFKWKDQNGRVKDFRLVDKVSFKWQAFGSLIKLEDDQLDAWASDFPQDTSRRCWRKVMGHWIENGGGYPVTWDGLCSMLNDVGKSEVAKDLKKALASAFETSDQHQSRSRLLPKLAFTLPNAATTTPILVALLVVLLAILLYVVLF